MGLFAWIGLAAGFVAYSVVLFLAARFWGWCEGKEDGNRRVDEAEKMWRARIDFLEDVREQTLVKFRRIRDIMHEAYKGWPRD